MWGADSQTTRSRFVAWLWSGPGRITAVSDQAACDSGLSDSLFGITEGREETEELLHVSDFESIVDTTAHADQE
jgi:hypothetical protein